MRMRTGQLWECRNGACGCEILVVAKSEAKSTVDPRCSCGSLMKKAYWRAETSRRHGLGHAPNAHQSGGPGRAAVMPTRVFLSK
jgi:hypothetical protein